MNVKELKKYDIINYSYKNGSCSFREDRDLVSMAGPTLSGIIITAFGGMFAYDLKNLIITKVWREDNNGEYHIIYEVEETNKYSLQLLKYPWDDTVFNEVVRVIAKDQKELDEIILRYKEKWNVEDDLLVTIEGWE